MGYHIHVMANTASQMRFADNAETTVNLSVWQKTNSIFGTNNSMNDIAPITCGGFRVTSACQVDNTGSSTGFSGVFQRNLWCQTTVYTRI